MVQKASIKRFMGVSVLIVLQILILVQLITVSKEDIGIQKKRWIEHMPEVYQSESISVYAVGSLSENELAELTGGMEQVARNFPLYSSNLSVRIYYLPNTKTAKAGYYSIADTDIILYNCDSDTVAHELIHAYNNAYMAETERHIDEGVAEYFENENPLPYNEESARRAYELQKAFGMLSYDFCRECIAWLIEQNNSVEDILSNSERCYNEFVKLFEESGYGA